ncbi:MAG TPA: hypothetical protein VNB29_03770, partial [Chthoniobacterales bacterium]|nr:hypothetical protein [Chthoniobacterales bacterium]
KRATSASGPFSAIGTPTVTSYVDSTVAAGTTYYYQVTAVNAYGTSGSSATSSVTPTTLSQQMLGGTGGSGTYSGGVFTLTGISGDIWGTSDVCRYAYQTMTGDGSIIARVTGIGGTYAYTKSGVMIRESLNANSVNVLMSLLYNGSTNFQYRPTTGAASTYTTRIAGAATPSWVRLDRVGNDFYGYYSTDGATWFSAGNVTLTLPSTIYIGLTQSQGNAGTFDNALIRD